VLYPAELRGHTIFNSSHELTGQPLISKNGDQSTAGIGYAEMTELMAATAAGAIATG